MNHGPRSRHRAESLALWEDAPSWGNDVEQYEADLFLDGLVSGSGRRTRRPGEAWRGEASSSGPSSMIAKSRLATPGFHRVPRSSGYYFARPVGANDRTWGRLALVFFILRVAVRWAVRHPDRPFGLGDLDNESDARMTDHESHNGGAAVDLYVINKHGRERSESNGVVSNRTDINSGDYDQALTKELGLLIKEVIDSGFPTIVTYFNDDQVRKALGNKPNGIPYMINDTHRCALRRPPKTPCQPGDFHMHDDHIHVLLHGTHPHSADHARTLLAMSWTRD